jgi:hypothetical protein
MKIRLVVLEMLHAEIHEEANRHIFVTFCCEGAKTILRMSQFCRFGLSNINNLSGNSSALKKNSAKVRLQRKRLRFQMHFITLPRSLVKTNLGQIFSFDLFGTPSVYLPSVWAVSLCLKWKQIINRIETCWMNWKKKLKRDCLYDVDGNLWIFGLVWISRTQ